MIDFNSFELTGKQVMIEYPTKSSFGLILINDDNKSLSSGWFKVVKTAKDVTQVKQGEEAYVYFHNKPLEVDELILKSRKDQKKQMEKDVAKGSLILPEPTALNGLAEDKGREFGIIPENFVVLTRTFENV